MRELDPETMSPQEFAQTVDRLGAEGFSQEQIAGKFGLSRHQVRWRLLNAGFIWGAQTRVRVAHTGEIVTAEPAEPAEPAEVAA